MAEDCLNVADCTELVESCVFGDQKELQTDLIYGHAAGIVLVISLGINQLGGQRVLSTASRTGRGRRGRQVMSVQIDLGKSLAHCAELGVFQGRCG